MTTEQIEERAINIDVKSVATVDGRFGPQWQCQIVLQGISEFEKRAWINDANAQTDNNRVFDPKAFDQPVPGTVYPCIVRRGDLTKDRDGNLHDGSRDYHYNWKIVEFDTEKEPNPNFTSASIYDEARDKIARGKLPTAQVSGAPKPVFTDMDPRQHSIERQVVFKAAVDLAIAHLARTPDHIAVANFPALIEVLADTLWWQLQNIGVTAPEAVPEAPESDVAPDDGSDDEIDAMLAPPAVNPQLPRQAADPNEGEQPPLIEERSE